MTPAVASPAPRPARDLRAGGCLCGGVRWACIAPPLWQRFLHGRSFRRNCAAAVAACLGLPRGAFRWTAAAPLSFASSPVVSRGFCGRCGTPVCYENAGRPGEFRVSAAALDDPLADRPEGHDFGSEHLPWLAPADALPRSPRDSLTSM